MECSSAVQLCIRISSSQIQQEPKSGQVTFMFMCWTKKTHWTNQTACSAAGWQELPAEHHQEIKPDSSTSCCVCCCCTSSYKYNNLLQSETVNKSVLKGSRHNPINISAVNILSVKLKGHGQGFIFEMAQVLRGATCWHYDLCVRRDLHTLAHLQ